MDLEKIAGLLSGLSRPRIADNLCSRKRSPRSNCRRCKDVCPTGGIMISSDGVTVEECSGCGLCSAACPNGVFHMPDAGERYLMARAREVGQNSPETVVYCLKSTRESRQQLNGVGVACLGQVTAEAMIAMAAESGGSLRFFYRSQDCAGCGVTRGGAVFEENLAVARRLLEAAMIGGQRLLTCASLEKFATRPVSAGKPSEVNESRREFFTSFLKGLRRVPVALADEILGPPEKAQEEKPVWERPREFASRRRGLADTLRRLGGNQLPQESPVPFPRLAIAGACYFCSACSRLCPAGALRQGEGKEGDQELQVDFSLCTACGLCVDICPQRAMEFQEGLTLGDLVAEEYTNLDKGDNRECPVCGEVYVGNQRAGKCPRCTLFGARIETEGKKAAE